MYEFQMKLVISNQNNSSWFKLGKSRSTYFLYSLPILTHYVLVCMTCNLVKITIKTQ